MKKYTVYTVKCIGHDYSSVHEEFVSETDAGKKFKEEVISILTDGRFKADCLKPLGDYPDVDGIIEDTIRPDEGGRVIIEYDSFDIFYVFGSNRIEFRGAGDSDYCKVTVTGYHNQ